MKKLNFKNKKLIIATLISILLFSISVPIYAKHHYTDTSYNLGNNVYSYIYGTLDVSWSGTDSAEALTEYSGYRTVPSSNLYVNISYDDGVNDPWHFMGYKTGSTSAKYKARRESSAFRSEHVVQRPAAIPDIDVGTLKERW